MVRIAVIGGSGYTARELLRILSSHPHAEICAVTSRSHVGESLASVHPSLSGLFDISFTEWSTESNEFDFVFSCLPHAASAEIVFRLPEGTKVVDFSADYRLNDLETYESWYKVKHPEPESFGQVPYGLPEFFRSEISRASRVANPGCFPTSALLPLVPLFENQVIGPEHLIVDSKTGISGAGRNAKLRFHFPESNESVAAYSVGQHRHGPEIEHLIQRKTGRSVGITFTPHLIPMTQGILSTIYVRKEESQGVGEIADCWKAAFASEPFVQIVDQPPSTADVKGTNRCHLFCAESGQHIVLISAIDNLIKGASGAAVQNFNLMNQFEETLALA